MQCGMGWSGVDWVGKGDVGWGEDVKFGWVGIGAKLGLGDCVVLVLHIQFFPAAERLSISYPRLS